ncbi:MAG TPA: S41 family peptidase [Acetobacteraceae bacterium]|nr:S41 family peptidase [Acetobacteraceae bacterium]
MIRIAFLMCLCLAWVAYAQGQPTASGFNIEAFAAVQAEAIEFMVPRTLDPVTAEQLAAWGLSGLTTIDPTLTAYVQDANLELLQRGRPLITVTASTSTPASWAQAAARIVAAAYAASPAVRQIGQPAVTKVLFDEMLAHIDPYSRYLPPIEALGDRDRRVGRAGIGVTLVQHGRAVTVRDVVIGSPGALAGIRPGDVIQWVNGRTALNKDRDFIEELLNGPEGTEVRMGWVSPDGSTRGATLTRIMIPPETVFPRRSGDIEVIEITGFSQTTDAHVIQVVRDSLRQPRPVTGIILDLRGNRGGLLRTAVATAEPFLPPGVVVQTAGRAPETNRIWKSTGSDMAKGVRMVVMVDGSTASAAEVLAAALSDRGRAVVMGSSTFGKGVVQTIDPLPDGGELFLTWSRILAPRGWPIQSLGVMPQVCTSKGDDVVRAQLAALASGKWLMEFAVGRHDAARAPLTPDQIVTIREPCPAADPRDGDLAIAERLVEAPKSYAAALLEPMEGER